MVRPLLLVILVIFAAAISGCLSSKPGAVPPEPEEPASTEETGWTPPSEPNAAAVAPNGAPYTTYNSTGHVTADVEYLGIDPTSAGVAAVAEVPRNATGIVAELRWTGTVSDYDIVLVSPKFCPGDTANWAVCSVYDWVVKDTPGAFRVSRPAGSVSPGALRLELNAQQISDNNCGGNTCKWYGRPWWNVAVQSDYELKVTVFSSGNVPEGFTAFSQA